MHNHIYSPYLHAQSDLDNFAFKLHEAFKFNFAF